MQRILFITLSCVGDAVMTTPVLQALHNRYPEALIDIVGDQRSGILFSRCPYLGTIIYKDKKKLLRGSVDLLKRLRNTYYDLIVDLRTDGLVYLMRGRKRYGKWFSKPYGPHCVESLMGIIRPIHGDRPIPNIHIWFGEKEKVCAEAALSVLPGGNWLAFAPGVGGIAEKIWPAENYAALANNFSDIFAGVILVGGAEERCFTEAVSKNLTLPYIDLAGETDLLQAAAVLSRAVMFAGSDSGLGHVAAAVSVPTLTFFSVDTPERVLPWGNNAAWLLGENKDARNIPLAAAIEKTDELIGAQKRMLGQNY